MSTVNEILRDGYLRHQTYLLRYSGQVRNEIIEVLDATEKALSEAIKLGAGDGLASVQEWERFKKLRDEVTSIRAEAWESAEALLTRQMVDLAKSEMAFTLMLNDTALPVVVDFNALTSRQLRSIAVSRPFEGRVMSGWAKKMASDDIARIHSAIQTGLVARETSQQIARRVVGTGLLDGKDGATQLTRQQVDSIVRTATMHVSAETRRDFFDENSDLFTMEVFVATLDSRTTPQCRANDGKRFKMGEGPQPPLHWNCRSLRLPVVGGETLGVRPAKVTTEKSLLRDYAKENGFKAPATRDGLPHGHKGTFDDFARKRIREMAGTVPAKESYQTWLTKQSKEFQRDVLGPTRAKLFADGNLKLDRFVNRNGDELTLAELAKKEKAAFKAAGLDIKKYL